LIHGILHLTGYDHGTAAERRDMWRRQQLILAACGIQAQARAPVARQGRSGPARPTPPRPGRRGVGR
jgi:hypothetical protein